MDSLKCTLCYWTFHYSENLPFLGYPVILSDSKMIKFLIDRFCYGLFTQILQQNIEPLLSWLHLRDRSRRNNVYLNVLFLQKSFFWHRQMFPPVELYSVALLFFLIKTVGDLCSLSVTCFVLLFVSPVDTASVSCSYYSALLPPLFLLENLGILEPDRPTFKFQLLNVLIM